VEKYQLPQGSYFPDWLLERRRSAEQALVTVVATNYLLRVLSSLARWLDRRTRRRYGRTVQLSAVDESAEPRREPSRPTAAARYGGRRSPLDRHLGGKETPPDPAKGGITSLGVSRRSRHGGVSARAPPAPPHRFDTSLSGSVTASRRVA
jgi:hypothetical protein